MGEESCCVRDGSVHISIPVVCVCVLADPRASYIVMCPRVTATALDTPRTAGSGAVAGGTHVGARVGFCVAGV